MVAPAVGGPPHRCLRPWMPGWDVLVVGVGVCVWGGVLQRPLFAFIVLGTEGVSRAI